MPSSHLLYPHAGPSGNQDRICCLCGLQGSGIASCAAIHPQAVIATEVNERVYPEYFPTLSELFPGGLRRQEIGASFLADTD